MSTYCPILPFTPGGFRLTAVGGNIPSGAQIALTSTGYDVASLDTPTGFANGGTTGGIRIFALASGLAENSFRDFPLSAGLPVSVDEPVDFTLSVQSSAFGSGAATLRLDGAEFPAMSMCPPPPPAPPTITFTAFSFSGGTNNFGQVDIASGTGVPLVQAFQLEGHVSGGWTPIYDLSTDVSGHWGGTIPPLALTDYDMIRASATVPGFPQIFSATIAVPIP